MIQKRNVTFQTTVGIKKNLPRDFSIFDCQGYSQTIPNFRNFRSFDKNQNWRQKMGAIVVTNRKNHNTVFFFGGGGGGGYEVNYGAGIRKNCVAEWRRVNRNVTRSSLLRKRRSL